MSRHTADFQAPAADGAATGGAAGSALLSTTALSYESGEVVVSPTERIQEDEIVFIVQQQQAAASNGGRSYQLCWLRETSVDAAHPFQFGTLLLTDSALGQLPERLRRKHLLKEPVFKDASISPSLYVVVSTGSGLKHAQPFYEAVLRPLLGIFGLSATIDETRYEQAGPHTYNLLVTSSPRSITEFARTLAAQAMAQTIPGPAMVVLLSGDGGVVDLINGIAEQKAGCGSQQRPIISVLPFGTGNALFHSLHRPQYAATAAATADSSDKGADKPTPTGPSSLVLGLRTLFKGRVAPLPNFEATFSPGSHTVSYSSQAEDGKEASLKEQAESVDRLRGVVVASYGFHAQLVWESDTPEYRKHGDKRFGMAAQELLKISHEYVADVKVTEAGKEPRVLGHRFNYVLATMVSNLEKTFTISPASQPLDGQLQLVHFGLIGGERTMEVMMAAYNNGAHVGMRWPRSADASDGDQEMSVGYDAIDELEVSILEKDPRWRKVCIDGTIVEIPEGGWMRVRKEALPVLRIIADN